MKLSSSSFLFTALLVPSTEVKGACTWDSFTGKRIAGGFADNDSTLYSTPEEAQARCLELGTLVCKAINCGSNPVGCKVKSGNTLVDHAATSYLPSADCATEVIPSVADDPAAAPTFPPTTLNAGDYEIEVVVNEGDDSGGEDDTATDMIAGVDPFNVTSFFEVSNKYNDFDGELSEEDQENNIVNAITVEVYTTVIGDDGESEDDCSKGDLIEDAGEFTISAGAVNHITDITYPSPRNDNTIVGATIVRLTNFMSNVIYVANVANEGEDTATGGTVEFCVRTSFKLEDETVSHIDSKKKIMVDLVGNFASLTVNNIVKADNQDFEVTVVKEINVETSVCNIRNEPVDAARTYKIGEQFRICVGPQEAALEEGYEIDNFVEVTCGSRSLVESGTTDGLTSIEALPLKNNRRAMKSVITTGYAVDGATTLSCTGKVSLSYTAPAVGGGGSGGGNGGVDPDGVATTGGGGSGTTTDTALAPAPTFAPTLDPTRTPTHAPTLDPTRAPTHAPTPPANTGLGGYSSPECIELCETPGYRRSPIPADTHMDRYTNVDHEDFKDIVQSYIANESGDESAKGRFGDVINCWDISDLPVLDWAFNEIFNFNEPLNCWNTAHITSMWGTFLTENHFNQDIGAWDTSRVTSMMSMFRGATGFNQDISGWETSSVTDMSFMFHEARRFNQNICNWDLNSATNTFYMLQLSACENEIGYANERNDNSNTVCQPCDNNDNGRRLQEADPVAGFDVAATLNKADDGPVALQQTAGGSITTGTSTLQALRDLQPITGLDPSGAGGGAEELLEGLFELNIEMDIPSNESSAPLSSSMTTTVAVIALGSILFVVSSMIY